MIPERRPRDSMSRRMPKRPPPVFQGLPSPSLLKMSRMSRDELETQVKNLTVEAQRLRTKIEHLKIQNPAPQERIAQLTEQAVRLDGLVKVAQERLAAPASASSPGPSSGGGYRGHSPRR